MSEKIKLNEIIQKKYTKTQKTISKKIQKQPLMNDKNPF